METIESPTICHVCTKAIVADSPHTTGYGIDQQGNKICYACCADRDRESMREHGRIDLYLSHVASAPTHNDTVCSNWKITNWPGSLVITSIHRVEHAYKPVFGRRMRRVTVWFTAGDGQTWRGDNVGDSQILRCRRVK